MNHDALAKELLAANPLLSSRAAAAAGLGPEALAGLLRRGVVERVTTGYYAVADPRLDDAARLGRLSLAVVARYGGRAVVSHHGALALAGLPLHAVDLSLAHLTYRRGGRYRRRSDHVIHAAISQLPALGPSTDAAHPAPGSSRPGPRAAPVMDVPAALVQVGLLWGIRALVVAGDAALARGLTTRAELIEAAERFRYCSGRAAVHAGIELLDPGSESPGESLLRVDVRRLGYDVVTQEKIRVRGRTYRADLRIKGTKVLLEFDGVGKYGGPADIRAEREREAALVADGWYVVRFMWQDLGRLDVIGGRIARALAASLGRVG